jgi:hypothetical protein
MWRSLTTLHAVGFASAAGLKQHGAFSNDKEDKYVCAGIAAPHILLGLRARFRFTHSGLGDWGVA